MAPASENNGESKVSVRCHSFETSIKFSEAHGGYCLDWMRPFPAQALLPLAKTGGVLKRIASGRIELLLQFALVLNRQITIVYFFGFFPLQ